MAGSGEAIHQVREQDDIELPQVRAQGLGITRLEPDPATVNLRRHHRRGGTGQNAFLEAGVGEGTLLLQMPRYLDEPVRMVNTDDLGAVPRQLERRAAHGAAEVQRPGGGPQPGEVKTLAHTPRRVAQGA